MQTETARQIWVSKPVPGRTLGRECCCPCFCTGSRPKTQINFSELNNTVDQLQYSGRRSTVQQYYVVLRSTTDAPTLPTAAHATLTTIPADSVPSQLDHAHACGAERTYHEALLWWARARRDSSAPAQDSFAPRPAQTRAAPWNALGLPMGLPAVGLRAGLTILPIVRDISGGMPMLMAA